MENIFEGLRSRKTLKAIVTRRSSSSCCSSTESTDEKMKVVNGGITEVVEEEEPLSPSARMFHEPHFNVNIIAIMGSKTKINPDVVKAGLVNTLLKHPRFCSLQVKVGAEGGEMKWVPTEVNLDNHVIIPDIDPNMESPDQFVEDYISNLSRTRIDLSKPLWDLHLINVKTAEAEATGVFRIHHSLGDGSSLMSLLLACTRQTANPDALPTVPAMTKRLGKKKSGGFWGIFTAILGVFWLVWNTMVDIFMFFVTLMFLRDTETPFKGVAGVEFAPKRFVYRTVSLDDIKLVKNAMNTTINDVVLGVTTAGLSRYMNRRYGEGKKDKGATEKENNLPKNIRLRSTVLVNIRPAAGIQALADMMDEKTDAKWGNLLGYVLFPFKISLRDNPLDYIREAKAVIDRKKNSYEALYTFFISEVVIKLFGIKAASALSHKILTHTTMSFSNVVGPLEEIGFYGHPMAYLAPSFYGVPHAFTINFQSYVNKMTIVLAVDESQVPDPHQLCDDLEESLKLIKDAVVAHNCINNC